jgi:hypothetical protein
MTVPPPAAHRRADVAFWGVLAVLLLLALWPVWATDLLPVVDAGSHLQLIRIMHEYADSALLQKHFVRVHAIVPYLTYYKAVDLVAYLTDLERANRIVLSLCLAALPLSALSLLRAAGRSRWLVLAVVPWLLNPDFFMGFFNFLMSIPLFLWLLGNHLRLLAEPKLWRAVLVAALLCVMAATHYLLWSVSLVLLPLLALAVGVQRGWRQALGWPLREVVIGLPSLAVLAPWFLRYFVFADGVQTSDQAVAAKQGSLLERLSNLYAGVHLSPLNNLRQLFDHLFDRVDAPGALPNLWHRPGETLSLVWLCGLGLWLLGASLRRPDEVGTDADARRGNAYTGWALVLLAMAYLVLPQHLLKPIWLWGVNFRLTEVLAVLAVVALPLNPLRPPAEARRVVWTGTALLVSVAVLLPLVTVRQFRLARTEYGDLRAAMQAIPPGRRVLALRREVTGHYLKDDIFNNLTEWYAILRGGYVPYSFADTSSKPFVVNKATALPAPPWDNQYSFSWQSHGQYYDYVVVYRQQPDAAEAVEAAIPPAAAVLAYAQDHWRVYRNLAPEPYPPPTEAELADQAERFAVERLQRLLCLETLAAMRLAPAAPSMADEVVGAALDAAFWRVPNRTTLAPLGWPSPPGPPPAAPHPPWPGALRRMVAPLPEVAPLREAPPLEPRPVLRRPLP